MKSKRKAQALQLLLGGTIMCLAFSAAGEIEGSIASLVATCCHALRAALPGDLLMRLGLFARGVVGFVVLTSLVRAGRILLRNYQFNRQVLLGATVPAGGLADLCQELGLSASVVVFRSSAPLAFCYGFFRPRIGVSTALVALLSKAELKAVLLHEAHHLRRYDPLRTLLLEVVAAFLFFLPLAAEIRTRLITAAELAADRYAIRHAGRYSLAGALYKLLQSMPTASVEPHAAAPFAGQSAADVRIAHLLGDSSVTPPLSTRSIGFSSFFLLLGCVVFRTILL